MKSQPQILFDNAVSSYLNDDRISFCQILTELEIILTCNCFYNEQPIEIWQTLKNKALEIVDRSDDYTDNLSKGFIFLKAKDQKTSFEYLSKAIKINPLSSLPYSFRAKIDNEISQTSISDSRKAVEFSPTARNYYGLAGSLSEVKNIKHDLTHSKYYYDRACSLYQDFACAYNNKGHLYKKLAQYDEAIKCFEKCIKINPEHWCYYSLWDCLTTRNKQIRALEVAIIGSEKHPSKTSYQYALGHAYMKRRKYESAIFHFELYLKSHPTNIATQNYLIDCRKQFLISSATSAFTKDNFIEAVKFFDEFLNAGNIFNSEELLRCYLIAQVKSNNSSLTIGYANEFYQHLINETYKKLFENGQCGKDSVGKYDLSGCKQIYILLPQHPVIRFKFGKFKGSNVVDTIDTDPEYVLWCIINIFNFYIDNKLLLNVTLKSKPNYIKALELNLIKTLYAIKSYNSSQFSINSKNMDDYMDNHGGWVDEYGNGHYNGPYSLVDNFKTTGYYEIRDVTWDIDELGYYETINPASRL